MNQFDLKETGGRSLSPSVKMFCGLAEIFDENADEYKFLVEEQFCYDCKKVLDMVQEKTTANLVEELAKLWTNFNDQYESSFNRKDKCLQMLLMCTAKIILDVKYSLGDVSSPGLETRKTDLEEAVKRCAESIQDSTPRRNLCISIGSLIQKPWTSSAFSFVTKAGNRSALGISNEAAETLWSSESWILLDGRLDYLTRLKKPEALKRVRSLLHVLLSKGQEFYAFKNSDTKKPSDENIGCFNLFMFPYENFLNYLELYAILMFKGYVDVKAMAAWDEKVRLQVIERLSEKTANKNSTRLFPNCKFWKEVEGTMKLVIKTAAWMSLKSEGSKMVKELFVKYLLYLPDRVPSPLDEVLERFDEIASTDYMYHVVDTVIHFMGITEISRSKLVEIYIRAITKDLNDIEAVKTSQLCDKERIEELNKTLSSRFIDLAVFFIDFPQTVRACTLTSFSLNPCKELFVCLFPSSNAHLVDKKKSAELYLPKQKLNVISQALLNFDSRVEEDLQLPPHLCSDLLNITNIAQYHGLFRWNTAEAVEEAGVRLIKEESLYSMETKALEFLSIDYEKYKHFPSQYDSDDDGIENGYREGERRKRKINKANTGPNNVKSKKRKISLPSDTSLSDLINNNTTLVVTNPTTKAKSRKGTITTNSSAVRPLKSKKNGRSANMKGMKAVVKAKRKPKNVGEKHQPIKLEYNPWDSYRSIWENLDESESTAKLGSRCINRPHNVKETCSARNVTQEEETLALINKTNLLVLPPPQPEQQPKEQQQQLEEQHPLPEEPQQPDEE